MATKLIRGLDVTCVNLGQLELVGLACCSIVLTFERA